MIIFLLCVYFGVICFKLTEKHLVNTTFKDDEELIKFLKQTILWFLKPKETLNSIINVFNILLK